jgi:hypothetical protein
LGLFLLYAAKRMTFLLAFGNQFIKNAYQQGLSGIDTGIVHLSDKFT